MAASGASGEPLLTVTCHALFSCIAFMSYSNLIGRLSQLFSLNESKTAARQTIVELILMHS